MCGELKITHGAMMTAYRSVAKHERWRYSKLSDVEALQKLNVAAPIITLRLKRLRLFVNLIARSF